MLLEEEWRTAASLSMFPASRPGKTVRLPLRTWTERAQTGVCRRVPTACG